MSILINYYHKYVCTRIKRNILYAVILMRDDYIEGVDEIIERAIVDYKKYHYGDLLIDFLINCNCVMVKGRCAGNNDYTSISVNGTAVVDYTIVSHDYLHNCAVFVSLCGGGLSIYYVNSCILLLIF